MNSYIICTVPRSGSNLFCEVLTSTGVAGRPLEYFNPHYRDFFLERWRHPPATTDAEYKRLALRAGTTPNGVFGLKIQWFQVTRLSLNGTTREAAPRPSTRLMSHFPDAKCVFLTRHDKLRQAISWYRAGFKNSWWAMDEMQDPRTRTNQEPPFDYEAIKRHEEVLREHEQAWRELFAEVRITPLHIEYSELCADLQSAVTRVLEYIGLPGAQTIRIKSPRLKKQADMLTEQWVHACITNERARRVYDAGRYGPDYVDA